MYLVVIKLLEVFSRALFIVGATYFLPVAQAGQFGMLVTLASLFAFVGNYERHQDIQRRAVGLAPPEFDRLVKDALPLWSCNIAVALPVYVIVLMLLGRMPIDLALLTIPIAIGEQVGAHVYQMATVEPRYNRLVTLVAGKNAILAILAAGWLYYSSSHPTLLSLIVLWTAIQVVAIVAIVSTWFRIELAAKPEPVPLRTRLFRQYLASFTHFQVGALAVATLQFDRIGIGALLSLADTGTYFRHVLAVSFLNQFFSITFIARVTPRVFHAVRTGAPIPPVVRRTVTELMVIFAISGIGLASVAVADHALDNIISDRLSLSWPLMAILLTGTLIRIGADCAAIFCNAWHREKLILRAQLCAFVIGAAALFTATPLIGMTGPALAALVFSSTYICLLLLALRSISRKTIQ